MKLKLLLILIGLVNMSSLFSQYSTNPKSLFRDAEYFFLNEDYKSAGAYYRRALAYDPDNGNIASQLGRCYLQLPFKEEDAIKYLLRAEPQITLDYTPGVFKNKSASVQTYKYLGRAYHLLDQNEMALKYYRKYLSHGANVINDLEKRYVEQQIEACLRCELRTQMFDSSEMVNLGPDFNTKREEELVFVSSMDTMMVMVKKIPGVMQTDMYSREAADYKYRFYWKHIEEGKWVDVREFSKEVSDEQRFVPTFMSAFGYNLLLYRNNDLYGDMNDVDGGAIYITNYNGERWSEAEKLVGGVNTKAWEMAASLSMTSDTIYFASDREGGYGGLDIYYSVKFFSGEWSDAVNLGPEVNTEFDETNPYVFGNVLFFSSEGHDSFGGFDVFYAHKDANLNWSRVRNLSNVYNSPYDEMFFMPVQDGTEGYVSIDRRKDVESYGKSDVYKLRKLNISTDKPVLKVTSR